VASDSKPDIFWLDGSRAPIREANAAFGLRLDEATAAQYMKFFCDHLEGPDGWFDLQVVIGGVKRNADGDYLFRGLMHTARSGYVVDMRVGQDGAVEMLSDQAIGIGTVH
jgi:hypothetical protein